VISYLIKAKFCWTTGTSTVILKLYLTINYKFKSRHTQLDEKTTYLLCSFLITCLRIIWIISTRRIKFTLLFKIDEENYDKNRIEYKDKIRFLFLSLFDNKKPYLIMNFEGYIEILIIGSEITFF